MPRANKHVKKNKPHDDERTKHTTVNGSSTSVPGAATSTTVHKDNHGGEVSDVAHDPDLEGCAHGHAVADIASGGKSQGKACPTTGTTVPGNNGEAGDGDGDGNESTPPTGVGHGGNGQGNGADNGQGNSGVEHGKAQTVHPGGGNDD